MITAEPLDRRLSVAWCVLVVVCVATSWWAAWAILAWLTGHLLMSARWRMVGAGTKPLPVWEFFHWVALDSIDSEDADRARKAKGRGR